MKKILMLLIVLGLANIASARLGETMAEIYKRYGDNALTNEVWGLPARTFAFKEYDVVVVFMDGKSVTEEIKPRSERRMTDGECDGLVENVTGNKKLFRTSYAWTDPKGEVFAEYTTDHKLLIQTRRYRQHVTKVREQLDAKKSTDEKKKADGF